MLTGPTIQTRFLARQEDPMPLRIRRHYRQDAPPLCGNLDCLCPLEAPYHAAGLVLRWESQLGCRELLLCGECYERYVRDHVPLEISVEE